MNKQRRDAIDTLASRIEVLKATLEILRDEEQDYLDNMPEAFQQGDKGQACEASISLMDEAIDAFDSVVSLLNDSAR